MGEIRQAYLSLNKTLGLGLTAPQILAAEMQFKLDFAERMKFTKDLTQSPNKLMEGWEFSAVLTPRRRAVRSATKKTLTELVKEAQAERIRKTTAVAGKVTKVRRVTKKK